MDAERLKDALEDMVYQFGYRSVIGGKRCFTTGGLSALENAFEALGWDEGHVVEDGGCEIEGCNEWATCVAAYPRSLARKDLEPKMIGFGFLCGLHYGKWNGRAPESAPDDLGRLPNTAEN